MAGKSPSGNERILDPTFYKWMLILALGLLFQAGIFIAYEQSTGEPQTSTDIIDLGDEGEAPSGSSSRAAFEKGMTLYRSGDPVERAQGLAILAAASRARGAGPLKEALRDPHPIVRSRALELLQSYRIRVAPGTVIPFLSDANQNVRTAAAALLVSLPFDPAMMYSLASPLSSGDPGVITSALEVWKSFASRDPVGAAQALSPLLSSADPSLLAMALGALATLPDGALAPFKSALLDAASRHAGTPEGEQAAAAAARIP